VKTSYFANLHNIAVPLSISGRAPDWYVGPQCKLLAPKWTFFSAYKNGDIGPAEYTRLYHELVLKPLHVPDLYRRLVQDYTDEVTLLCYEAPGDFCHRRIVAQWFEEAMKIEIPEWEPPIRPIKGLEF